MKVLVVNCGSSSVKYSLFDMEKEQKIAWGLVECIGLEEAFYKRQTITVPQIKTSCKVANHFEAVQIIIKDLLDEKTGSIKDIKEIAVVGHRVVHGGYKFSKPVLVNEQVKKDLKECYSIAPLHTPHHYAGIEAVEKMLPGIPSVLVFDTAFHQTMPDYAYRYAIPSEYYEQDHVRRYGMHGTSHKYVTQKAAAMLNIPVDKVNLITCHLGNGSSITAIKNGKVIDTSMGFTPLAGLVMGTRCGDIDPAVIVHILSKYPKMTSDELNNLLNKQSGVAAVSGIAGGDMREVEDAMLAGDKKAELAFNMLCYSGKKYLCAYYGILNGIDGIVFTAGIGENSPLTREKMCEGLDNLGIKIDKALNEPRSSKERFISAADSKIKVMVIPTNEELMIARESIVVLNENK